MEGGTLTAQHCPVCGYSQSHELDDGPPDRAWLCAECGENIERRDLIRSGPGLFSVERASGSLLLCLLPVYFAGLFRPSLVLGRAALTPPVRWRRLLLYCSLTTGTVLAIGLLLLAFSIHRSGRPLAISGVDEDIWRWLTDAGYPVAETTTAAALSLIVSIGFWLLRRSGALSVAHLLRAWIYFLPSLVTFLVLRWSVGIVCLIEMHRLGYNDWFEIMVSLYVLPAYIGAWWVFFCVYPLVWWTVADRAYFARFRTMGGAGLPSYRTDG
ncbi:MAG: hypothetical protein JJU33_13665 [Phycisphaerales bacterium]|nr:hypothetical protein [Phycisphaerales bacterium]